MDGRLAASPGGPMRIHRRHRPVTPITFIRPRLPYFPYIDREDEQVLYFTVKLFCLICCAVFLAQL